MMVEQRGHLKLVAWLEILEVYALSIQQLDGLMVIWVKL